MVDSELSRLHLQSKDEHTVQVALPSHLVDNLVGEHPAPSGDGAASGSDAEGAPPGMPRVKKTRQSKRKEGVEIRPTNRWVQVDTTGRTVLVSSDNKAKLALKLGVQQRDLRLLDPMVAGMSPPAILDRERAIVVNLGSVKCIITLDYVLVVNPEDERGAALVQELKNKLNNPLHIGKVLSYPGLSRLSDITRQLNNGGRHTVLGLSFELKVLEICLDVVVQGLDVEARGIESVVMPALDKLTRRILPGDLEVVRRMKNRLTRLMKRVETTKEVLEKFLQDDEDMHRLNLTALEISRQATLRGEMQLLEHGVPSGSPHYRSRGPSKGVSRTGSLNGSDRDHLTSSSSSSSSGATSLDSQDEAEVAEVEMLLEAYQMHLDTTYNKLQTLEEYIQDTEDLVNVSLDTHRNRIIRMDIILTSVLTTLGLCTTLSGMFSLNLPFPFEKDSDSFLTISIAAASLGPLIFLGVFWIWAVRSRLLTS